MPSDAAFKKGHPELDETDSTSKSQRQGLTPILVFQDMNHDGNDPLNDAGGTETVYAFPVGTGLGRYLAKLG